uniref:long-chain-fatty-acid--CoA ligase n=1 Tax=Heterorhabditis bacteriophora TaxID=37862 RepID=A0A1I7WB91_HETBA
MFYDFRLVFNRIGKLLGGNIRCVLSGGAPLSPETQRYVSATLGYGLTETCGGGTLHDLSTGSVGAPLTCCEIVLEDWKDGITNISESNNDIYMSTTRLQFGNVYYYI